MVTMIDFLHGQVDGARNEGRIELEFRAGPQIKNDNILPGILFLAQFSYRDPRHAQLTQNPLPLPVFETDIERRQPNRHGQDTAAHAGQSSREPLNLVAEQIAEENEAASVKQRA